MIRVGCRAGSSYVAFPQGSVHSLFAAVSAPIFLGARVQMFTIPIDVPKKYESAPEHLQNAQ